MLNMYFLKVILVIFLSGTVYCENALLEPCDAQDTGCVAKSTEDFISKTYMGIPDYGIESIDPFYIKNEIKVANGLIDENVAIVKNVQLSGLKNQKFSSFKMDIDQRKAMLATKVDDLVISGDIFTDKTPLTFKVVANVVGTSNYTYDVKPDSKGVDHFEVGPEIITCEVLSRDSNKKLLEGNETSALNGKKLKNSVICKIVIEAYKTVIQNLRTVARLLPKTSFFTNV